MSGTSAELVRLFIIIGVIALMFLGLDGRSWRAVKTLWISRSPTWVGEWHAYTGRLLKTESRTQEVDLGLSSAGREVYRRRYARLLLPWSEPGGDRYVTLMRFEKQRAAA